MEAQHKRIYLCTKGKLIVKSVIDYICPICDSSYRIDVIKILESKTEVGIYYNRKMLEKKKVKIVDCFGKGYEGETIGELQKIEPLDCLKIRETGENYDGQVVRMNEEYSGKTDMLVDILFGNFKKKNNLKRFCGNVIESPILNFLESDVFGSKYVF